MTQNASNDLENLLSKREALVRHRASCQGELGDAWMDAFMVTLSSVVGSMALGAVTGVVLNSYYGVRGIVAGFVISIIGFVACGFIWRRTLAKHAPEEEARKTRLAEAEAALADLDERIQRARSTAQ